MPSFKVFQPLARATGGDRRKMLMTAMMDTAQAGDKVLQLAMRDPELHAMLSDMNRRRNQLINRIEGLDEFVYNYDSYRKASNDLASRIQERLMSEADELDDVYFGLIHRNIPENPYMYVKDPAVRNSPELLRAKANFDVAQNFETAMRVHPDFKGYRTLRAIPPLVAGGGATAAALYPGEAQASTWAPPVEPGLETPEWYTDPVELLAGGVSALPLRMFAPVARAVGTGVGAFTDMMLNALISARPTDTPEEYWDMPQ